MFNLLIENAYLVVGGRENFYRLQLIAKFK